MTGPTLAGQLLSFISLPVFALHYSPDQFGLAATCISSGSILGAALTLRLDTQLFLSKDLNDVGRKAISIIVYSSIIGVILIAILSCVYYCIRTDLRFDFETFVISIGCAWAIAIQSTGTAYLSYNKRFVEVGISRFIQPFIVFVYLTLAIFAQVSSNYVVAVANLLGFMFAAGFSSLYIVRYVSDFDVRKTLEFAVSHARYIRYALPYAVANATGFMSLFMIMVGALYGPTAAGVVFLGYRLAGFPTNLLTASLSNLVNSEFAKRERINPIMISGGLLTLALFIYMPIGAVLPYGIEHYASDTWKPVGDVLYAILVLCITQMTIGPLMPLYMIRGGVSVMLVWELSRTCVSTFATYLACWYGAEFPTSTWIYCMVQVIFYIFLMRLIWRTLSGSRMRESNRLDP